MNLASGMMAAAGVICGLGLNSGLGVAGASTSPRATIISFTQQTTSDHTFNLGPKRGVAVGYTELIADNDMQGSKKIGHDGATCAITRLSHGTADDLCTLSLVLARGQIDLSGLTTSSASGPGNFYLAVVGGTGAYSDARGFATVDPSDPYPQVTLHIDN